MDNRFGKSVIAKALEYANYKWCATEQNVMHGVDKDGKFVETPDITWRGEILDCGWWKVGQINVGVAYAWGKASTIAEFEQGIKDGKYAGNVPDDVAKHGSFYCVSHQSVGVDCSGLLTICWNLSKKIATRDIPNVADRISLKEIRQGDVFALPGSHVMFFKEFTDEDKEIVRIIDATRSTGKVSEREFAVADLLEEGYEVYRKR